jgi:glycosyltransferase involved in cell wall biosynthesis/peptidoglycan/xylan/chitin deacetylase (PgdA/CDA1 family)
VRSLRILQVAYKSEIYGGEKVLLDLTKGLMEKGHHLFVASPSYGPLTVFLKAAGVKVFVFPMRKTYDLLAIFRLWKLLREYRIDVVHSHGLLVNTLSRIACYLANTPVSISTAHVPLNLKSGKQAQNLLEKLMIPYYLILDNLTSLFNHKVIAVSHAVKRDLMEQGIKPEKITVVQNGIDPNLLKGKKNNNDKELENKDSTIVGTITRLSPQKDLKTFLIMANLVIQEIPNVEFLVIGDGEQREELQTLTESLGLCNHVRFLGYREDARDILKSFDIFALSSLWEGLPIVILEAMAAEKPVVATAVDGVAEVVEHGKTGLLVEPEKPDLLAKSVIELIRNPNRAKGMGKRGRERLERYFSINRVINTVEQTYLSQMLNKRPSKYDWLKIYLKRIYSTLQYIGRQRSWENEDGVTALFYHSLDSGKPLTNFLKQIDYLVRHGYKVVPINDVVSYVKGKKTLPPRSVCLTFDDGYHDNYGAVFAILKKYDVPVTIFLSTKYMASDDSQEIDLGIGERFLSWGEIKEMACSGVCFGSHGYNHCDLTSLSVDKSFQEILLSKELIKKNLSGRIRYFSYPYGRYDRKTQGLVEKAGFDAAFTTVPGNIKPGDDPYALKRTLIAPSDSLFDFRKKIAGVFV